MLKFCFNHYNISLLLKMLIFIKKKKLYNNTIQTKEKKNREKIRVEHLIIQSQGKQYNSIAVSTQSLGVLKNYFKNAFISL